MNDYISTAVPTGSYVKIVRLRADQFAVATYTQNKPDLFAMSGRWVGKSYGEAQLHAQLWAAKGYLLRDEGGRR